MTVEDSALSRVEATKTLLRKKAVTHFDEPIQLASGQMSSHFVDGKAAFSHASDLRVACEAINALVTEAGIEFDAVGGLTLGADHLSVGVAYAADCEWFFVRKEAKGRGTGRQIEGATVEAGRKILVVEDIVSTGSSMFKALDVIAATGAEIVAATTLLDRGGHATAELERRGIPYFPIANYADVDLPPVINV